MTHNRRRSAAKRSAMLLFALPFVSWQLFTDSARAVEASGSNRSLQRSISIQKGVGSTQILVPGDREVWLETENAITSRTLRTGDDFPMRVSRNFMLGNHIVIPRGTPATGRITWRTGRGVYGKSAKMEFSLVDIKLDGQSIPLAGKYRYEGQGNGIAAMAVYLAAGIFPPLLIIGHSARIGQGTEFRGYTTSAFNVVLPSPSGAYISVTDGGVLLRQASTPSGFCYDMPRDYYGTGSLEHPVANSFSPMCWEM